MALDECMKKERSTFSDRIAASFVMLFLSFVTALIIWGVAVLIIGKATAGDSIVPFDFVVYFTVIFTVLAFLSPNVSLDCLGWIWKKIEKMYKEY